MFSQIIILREMKKKMNARRQAPVSAAKCATVSYTILESFKFEAKSKDGLMLKTTTHEL